MTARSACIRRGVARASPSYGVRVRFSPNADARLGRCFSFLRSRGSSSVMPPSPGVGRFTTSKFLYV
jgi:hypothetical protein